MIYITDTISLPEAEVQIAFVQSAGPGGQNVNKVATAATLRFDAAHSPSLPADVRQRLLQLAGSRLTSQGVIVIQAHRYRTQEQNRRDALQRLTNLLRRAAHEPRQRRPTKPTRASQQRRLETKKHHSALKRMRKGELDE